MLDNTYNDITLAYNILKKNIQADSMISFPNKSPHIPIPTFLGHPQLITSPINHLGNTSSSDALCNRLYMRQYNL